MHRLFFAFLILLIFITQGCSDAAKESGKDVQPPNTRAEPAAGVYNQDQSVKLICDDCIETYYSTDGSDPDKRSFKYIGPITVDADVVIRFFSIDANGNEEGIKSAPFTIDKTVPQSDVRPQSGTYSTNQSIQLDCSDVGTGCISVHYTFDGSLPDDNSRSVEPGGIIQVSDSVELSFRSKDLAGNYSGLGVYNYTIDNNLPVTTPNKPGGSYNSAITVELSCASGSAVVGTTCSDIYFTVNGSDPQQIAAQKYSTAINIDATGTTILKYFAVDSQGRRETIKTSLYTLNDRLPITTATPSGGDFTSKPVNVDLTCSVGSNVESGENCSVYFTLDEAVAEENFTLYAGPLSIVAEGVNHLRYYSVDNTGNRESTKSLLFFVDTNAPSITSRSLNGGEFLRSTVDIVWATDDALPGLVELSYSDNAGQSYINIGTIPDVGSYRWNTTALADGSNYRFRIVPIDKMGNRGGASTSTDFTIDNTPPVLSISSPSVGQFVENSINFSWTTTDDNVSTVQILLSNNNGQTFAIPIADNVNDTGNYNWTVNQVDGSTYQVKIVPTDRAGNQGNAVVRNFIIDRNIPVTTIISPQAGDILGQNLVVRWNTDDVLPDRMKIELGQGGVFTVLAANTTDNGIFNFDATGQNGTAYQIRLTPTDASGKQGASVTSAAFSIDYLVPQVNTSGLTISNVSSSGFNVDWTAASDGSAQQNDLLQYRVFTSLSNNLNSISAIEANGTAQTGWMTATTRATLSLLSAERYYVNVLVQDPAGNKNLYTANNAITKTLGVPDTSFSFDGRASYLPSGYSFGGFEDAVVDGQNRVVAVGRVYNSTASNYDIFIVRFTENGQIDSSFGDVSGATRKGYILIDNVIGNVTAGSYSDEAKGVDIDTNGRIIVAGFAQAEAATTNYDLFILAFDESGDPSSNFGGGSGKVLYDSGNWDRVYDVFVDGNNRIIAGGESNGFATIWRFSSTGAPDGSFGTGGIHTVNIRSLGYSLAPDSAGNIYLGGYVSGTPYKIFLLKVDANGQGVGSFNAGQPTVFTQGYISTDTNAAGRGQILYGIAVDANDRVLATGTIQEAARNTLDLGVWRFTSTGVLDNQFNGSGTFYRNNIGGGDFNDRGYAVKTDSDGNILVTGATQVVNEAVYVMRLTPSGNPDYSFGDVDSSTGRSSTYVSQGSSYGQSIDLTDTGKIVIGANSNGGLLFRLR